MVVDMIFDSLCRCFGVSETSQNSSRHSKGGDPIQSKSDGRVGGVLLNDKQFDVLFADGGSKKKYLPSKLTTNDIEQGHELAQAKQASSAYQKKRKSPASQRDEIFRSRDFERRDKGEQPTSSFSRIIGSHQGSLANALCFATPINEDDVSVDILKNESDCNTLNTAEDTITSTLFFERKYAHIIEHRPPMPLFSDFKVEEDQNELRRIVATDSHNSLKMIRLLNESVGLNSVQKKSEKMEKKDSIMSDEDVPPAVKIDSSASSGSSRN
jgi:hypothetical protein